MIESSRSVPSARAGSPAASEEGGVREGWNSVPSGGLRSRQRPPSEAEVVQALNNRNWSFVVNLLNEGRHPDSIRAGADGESALDLAILSSDALMVETLLGHGASPEGTKVPTPLCHAAGLEASESSKKIIRRLVEAGADPRKPCNLEGLSALDKARGSEYPEIAAWFEQASAEFPRKA